MKYWHSRSGLAGAIVLAGLAFGGTAQAAEACEGLYGDMPEIGRIAKRGIGPHTSKMWMLGCEGLDRDYAEFRKYKDYIPALGIARIRLQAGWARCEREKGKFDFAWLDEPIDWAVEHGVHPTLDLSYGNLIYEGGGQAGLAGEIPSGSIVFIPNNKTYHVDDGTSDFCGALGGGTHCCRSSY